MPDLVHYVVGGALVLAMIVTSSLAAAELPSYARIPLHLGVTGFSNFAPKIVGVLLWPAVGAVIYVVTYFITDPGPSEEWVGLGALVLLLIAQIAAYRSARRMLAAK